MGTARRPMVAVAATLMLVAAASCVTLVTFGLRSMAQDAAPHDDAAPQPARSQKKSQHNTTPAAKVPPATTAATPAASPAPPASASPNISAPLVKAGAGACAAQVDTLAATAMGGVDSYNTAAHWALTTPEHRPVSIFIGQKFTNPAVPYGATGVFAAPNGQGGCDGMAVQVVPSPMSCAKLRETLSARGKQVGDLAGIPLMEDAGGQTLLLPTGADACVLVGVRSAYAK